MGSVYDITTAFITYKSVHTLPNIAPSWSFSTIIPRGCWKRRRQNWESERWRNPNIRKVLRLLYQRMCLRKLPWNRLVRPFVDDILFNIYYFWLLQSCRISKRIESHRKWDTRIERFYRNTHRKTRVVTIPTSSSLLTAQIIKTTIHGAASD